MGLPRGGPGRFLLHLVDPQLAGLPDGVGILLLQPQKGLGPIFL